MARVSLKRLLRGATRRAVDELLAMFGEPVRVDDDAGKPLLGEAPGGERFPIRLGEVELGAVIGPPGASRVAAVLAHLAEREAEKLGLADETLGRYKELTLLYDISEKLSGILDVDEVCRIVVNEASSFLKASSASILMVDHRRGLLEPIASTVEASRLRPLVATAGVEGRVLITQRAEFVEDASTTDVGSSEAGVAALMVAPLRSGDSVFGILRVTGDERAAWTAGHLKFVTSIAGNAASAISHAMLHRERLRQQALRHQIERFASPRLLEAALGDRDPGLEPAIVTLFCDAGEIARYAGAELDHERLMALVRRATTSALHALMAGGATAQVSQSEIVVALFAEDGTSVAAQAAVAAARQIVRALDRRFGGFVDRSPGIGIARATLGDGEGRIPAFLAAVGAAASLQQRADGRILVDQHVADAAGIALPSAANAAGAIAAAYEVTA
jgi:putative methionine-R-sulfoxide reductase with GAF domain